MIAANRVVVKPPYTHINLTRILKPWHSPPAPAAKLFATCTTLLKGKRWRSLTSGTGCLDVHTFNPKFHIRIEHYSHLYTWKGGLRL
jgi:hypothetical protein